LIFLNKYVIILSVVFNKNFIINKKGETMGIYYSYIYEGSKRFHLAATEEEILKKVEKENLRIIDEKDGVYLLASGSSGTLQELDEDTNQVIRTLRPKRFIRNYYKKQHVTEKDFSRLCDDLNDGLIKFDDISSFNKMYILNLD
jgi:hypothetical protein